MTQNNSVDIWRMGSRTTTLYCTLCVVLIGFIMLLGGAIISGIAFTEVRPNIADENYERYIRSDLKRVIGPIMLSFGILCILSGCVFFGCSLFSASREHAAAKKHLQYNVKASQEYLSTSTPDAEKKMLSDV